MSAVVKKGRPAVTRYRLVERLGALTLVRVRIEDGDGRTRIRVHMAHIGHPGRRPPIRAPLPEAPAGHTHPTDAACRAPAFTHPVTGRDMEIAAPLPDDMAGADRHLAKKMNPLFAAAPAADHAGSVASTIRGAFRSATAQGMADSRET